MSTHPGQGGGVPEITPSELKSRLDLEQPIVLVDVREPHEYGIADLAEYDPVRIPLGDLPDRVSELDPDDNLVIYCRSGSRSGFAVQQLRREGFDKVWNLAGGLLAWRDDVDPSMAAY